MSYELTDQLDLHTFLPKECADVVEEYLRTAQEAGLTLSCRRHQRSAEEVGPERTTDRMEANGRLRRKVRPRPVRDEVHAAGALSREMHRERVVGAIHPAEWGEVACDQQPVAHASCSR